MLFLLVFCPSISQAVQPKRFVPPAPKILPFLLQGQKLEAQNNFQGAVQAYSQAIQVNPQIPYGYWYRGLVYLQKMRNWNAAKADFDKCLETWTTYSTAYCGRGICYLNLQNLQSAVKDLHKAIALDSNNILAVINLGTATYWLHDYILCEKVLSKAIALQPKMPQLYRQRGDARRQLGRYKDALSDLNIFLSMDSDNKSLEFKSVYSNRAQLKLNMGDLQGTIEDYTYAIKNWGYQVEFYYNRAIAHKLLKHFILSNQDIDTILHHTPLDHTARILMAENFRMTGQYQKSIEICTTILQLNQHDFQAFRNVLGQVNAAQASLKQVNDLAYLTRGYSRLALQDTTGAFDDWTKAEALGNTTATLFLGTTLRSQVDIFTTDATFPQPLQFFSRIDTTNNAELSVKGLVNAKGYDSAYCEIYVHQRLIQRHSMPLYYIENNKAPVHLRPRLEAVLQQYTLRFGLKSKDRDTIICTRDSLLCGDVFVVSGQSNIVLGKIDTVEYSSYIRQNVPIVL
jgi:tetratricopeptide (TPR) repeat protein